MKMPEVTRTRSPEIGSGRYVSGTATPDPGPMGPVLLFDGHCPLCHATVRFLLRHDRSGAVRFAPLDSAWALRALERHALDTAGVNSVCLVLYPEKNEEIVLLRSSAVLRALQALERPWPQIGRLFSLFPRPLRDTGYRLVARLRTCVFGRYEVCPLPAEEFRARFLSLE